MLIVDGVWYRSGDLESVWVPWRLFWLVTISMRELSNILWARTISSIIYLIITCVLTTLLIFG